MRRSRRPLVLVTLVTLLVGTLPVAAAPVPGWNLLDGFSLLAWIRDLWEGETVPTNRAGDGDSDPPPALRTIWSEDGSAMDPLGRTVATPNSEGHGIER